MSTTPVLPDRIRGFGYTGYTNVHTFLPSCPRLYGTETMPGFGDWNARVLLLAKDGAPTPVIRGLSRTEGDGAWRHAQRDKGDSGGYRSNDRLAQLASIIPGTKLYGSATANLLYDNPTWSRSLPGFWNGPLHDHLAYVLGWVINSMPNLRVIACLGRESWHLTTRTLGNHHLADSWTTYRDTQRHIVGRRNTREVAATAHFHPAARVSADRMQLGWGNLAAIVGQSG